MQGWGVQVQSLVRELRYHKPQAKAKKKKKGIVISFYKHINVFLPMLEKFLFLELSTVVYFLYLTSWIHKGPLSLKANM